MLLDKIQRREQRVILLEDLPDQHEYQIAQPKVGTSSRRSSSRLTKGPLGRTGPQAIAGTATTSTVLREPMGTGQRGQDSYPKADDPTGGEQTTDRTSNVDIGGQENPIGPYDVRNDVTMLRKSDAASMACASGEDSRAMAKDDHDAGSSRAVASDNQSVLHKSSARAASTGEKVPTTSPAAERSSESAVSVVQRPLRQTVSTRASSAATNKSRALSAQGTTRSSPRVTLLQLSPPRKRQCDQLRQCVWNMGSYTAEDNGLLVLSPTMMRTTLGGTDSQKKLKNPHETSQPCRRPQQRLLRRLPLRCMGRSEPIYRRVLQQQLLRRLPLRCMGRSEPTHRRKLQQWLWRRLPLRCMGRTDTTYHL